jgi:hypothetical protein
MRGPHEQLRNQGGALQRDLARRRTIHRRAIELAIWEMPAVSMAAIGCAYPPTRPRTTSGRSSPTEANNWIPTAGKDFWLIARFYGPDKVRLEKAWMMPDVEKVS